MNRQELVDYVVFLAHHACPSQLIADSLKMKGLNDEAVNDIFNAAAALL